MKPTIRHIAIMTVDPERLAKFYEDVFQMERLPRKGAGGSKAVYMTDGYLVLALLHNRGEGKPSGINHFGFQVESHGEISKRLDKFGLATSRRPEDRPFAEMRAIDPDGNHFDLSVNGFEPQPGDFKDKIPA
jgi:catechol 2,3-dioxygenase-like lactoylglutathione lyase family enzyme